MQAVRGACNYKVLSPLTIRLNLTSKQKLLDKQILKLLKKFLSLTKPKKGVKEE